MENQLALDRQLLHHPRGDALGQLVGTLHRPELRHHQMRVHVDPRTGERRYLAEA